MFIFISKLSLWSILVGPLGLRTFWSLKSTGGYGFCAETIIFQGNKVSIIVDDVLAIFKTSQILTLDNMWGQFSSRHVETCGAATRILGWLHQCHDYPDSKVHGANMGPTWVLSAPGGPHIGPISLAIRVLMAWLLASPGYQWPYHWLLKINGSFTPLGRIKTIWIISVLGNCKQWKYILTFLAINFAWLDLIVCCNTIFQYQNISPWMYSYIIYMPSSLSLPSILRIKVNYRSNIFQIIWYIGQTKKKTQFT